MKKSRTKKKFFFIVQERKKNKYGCRGAEKMKMFCECEQESEEKKRKENGQKGSMKAMCRKMKIEIKKAFVCVCE